MDFWSLISIAVTIGLTKAARTSTNKLLFLIKSEDFIEQVPETNLKSADKTTVVATMDFKRTLNQAVISYPHYRPKSKDGCHFCSEGFLSTQKLQASTQLNM